jgi:hypothetical protein
LAFERRRDERVRTYKLRINQAGEFLGFYSKAYVSRKEHQPNDFEFRLLLGSKLELHLHERAEIGLEFTERLNVFPIY